MFDKNYRSEIRKQESVQFEKYVFVDTLIHEP